MFLYFISVNTGSNLKGGNQLIQFSIICYDNFGLGSRTILCNELRSKTEVSLYSSSVILSFISVYLPVHSCTICVSNAQESFIDGQHIAHDGEHIVRNLKE